MEHSNRILKTLSGRCTFISLNACSCKLYVLRYSQKCHQFVMNTQELFDSFFARVFHTISSYMMDECQFQDFEIFSAFLWGEFRQIWTAIVSRPTPAVEYEDRAAPHFRLPHSFLSPCQTFSLSPARCQAVLLGGGHCWRRAIPPFTLCRPHAEAWILPSPFPYDPTAGE